MAKMSNEELERFLADLHVGVLAVERPGRAPLAVPIWYAHEPGGELSISTSQNTLIRAAGRASITAQDEAPPYKYVTVEGDVTFNGRGRSATELFWNHLSPIE